MAAEEQFTRGRYDLCTGPAKGAVVRRVQRILRTQYQRVLTTKQVQILRSDLERRDQDLLKRMVEEMESGNGSQGQDQQQGTAAPRPSSSGSSSPGPSHHSQRAYRRRASRTPLYVPLSTYMRLRGQVRRLKEEVRKTKRSQGRKIRILQNQMLEMREMLSNLQEEIRQLKGTGGILGA